MTEYKLGVKERIRSILHYKKTAVLVTAVAVMTGIALAVCFLTDPKKDPQNEAESGVASSKALGEVVSWMYVPDGIASHTAFGFNFAVPCTHIALSCSDGLLWDLYAKEPVMEKQLQIEHCGPVGWVPTSVDENVPVENAEIIFTAYYNEEALYTGKLMASSTGFSGDMTSYEVYLEDAPGLILDKVGNGTDAIIMTEESTKELCIHVPGTYLSTEWKDEPNPNPEQYETFELRWDTYTCKNCGKTFAYNTGIYREKQSETTIRNTGWQLDAEDFEEPIATAEKILSHAFSYNGDGYTAQVSQNGDLWNITFTGEHTYVVEMSEELPYPQSIYQFCRVSPDETLNVELLPEGEFVTIAQDILFAAYGLDGDQAETRVFVYEDEACVQFVISETEIFQVRIRIEDLLPLGIFFFDDLDTAQQCLEEAGDM